MKPRNEKYERWQRLSVSLILALMLCLGLTNGVWAEEKTITTSEAKGMTFTQVSEPSETKPGEVKLTQVSELNKPEDSAFGVFVIPQEITGEKGAYTVTSLGAQAFKTCETIKAVAIPDSVKTIDPAVFEVPATDKTKAPTLNLPLAIYANADSAAAAFAKEKKIEVVTDALTLAVDNEKEAVEEGEGPTPTVTPEPSAVEPSPSVEPTATPETSVSPEPSATPEPSPSVSPSATPSPSASVTPSPSPSVSPSAQLAIAAQSVAAPSVTYSTHVQDVGWQKNVSDGATAGTSGQSKRLEGIKINLDAQSLADGSGISYRTHIEDIGWQEFKTNGALSGTTGQSKRLEAIEIKLTGKMAETYDVYYRVHSQTYGWMGWAKNGDSAGTSGLCYRLEAIQIKIVKKGDAAPGSTSGAYVSAASLQKNGSLAYKTHVQNIGWQGWTKDGNVAGTTGRRLRVEALQMSLSGVSGSIQYRTHVQNIGWQGWVSNGATAGTTGRSLRVEAVEIKLTGEAALVYDVYYRVHVQNIGWMGWSENGEAAGTIGKSLRAEAIQVKLVAKGGTAPGSVSNSYTDYSAKGRLVSMAKSQVGYRESANGYSKYGYWYEQKMNATNFRYGEWCAMFVSWCANQAGISENSIPCHAYCPTGINTFRNWGRFKARSYVPAAGDIIYFTWGHVGVVSAYKNGIIYTVEGNTGAGEALVVEKSYPYNWAYISGFGTY